MFWSISCDWIAVRYRWSIRLISSGLYSPMGLLVSVTHIEINWDACCLVGRHARGFWTHFKAKRSEIFERHVLQLYLWWYNRVETSLEIKKGKLKRKKKTSQLNNSTAVTKGWVWRHFCFRKWKLKLQLLGVLQYNSSYNVELFLKMIVHYFTP